MIADRLEMLTMFRERAVPELMLANAEPYGDSVRRRKRKQTDPRPSHIYLIYISLDENGLVVRQVEGGIGPEGLDEAENQLIRDAMTSTNLAGSNFEPIIFTKPTNFTVVLDEDGWEFYYPEPDNPEPHYPETHDPIVFISEKVFINPDGTSNTATPASRNRAFYDLEPITKTVDGKDRDGIRCINHFTKNANGDPVGSKEKVDYSFNLFLRVPFSRTTAQKKITIILDPDGQNQGPPD